MKGRVGLLESFREERSPTESLSKTWSAEVHPGTAAERKESISRCSRLSHRYREPGGSSVRIRGLRFICAQKPGWYRGDTPSLMGTVFLFWK